MDTERLKERLKRCDVLPVLVVALLVLSSSLALADLGTTKEWTDSSQRGAVTVDESDRLAFYHPASGSFMQITYLDNGTNKIQAGLNSDPWNSEYIETQNQAYVGDKGGYVYAVNDDGTIDWSTSVAGGTDEVSVAYDSTDGTVWAAAGDTGSGGGVITVHELDTNGNELRNFTISGTPDDIAYDADTERVYVAANSQLVYITDSGGNVTATSNNIEGVEVTADRVVTYSDGGTVRAYDKSLSLVWSETDGSDITNPLGAHDESDTVMYWNGSDLVVLNDSGSFVGVVANEQANNEIELFSDSNDSVGVLKYDLNVGDVTYYSTNASSVSTANGGGGGGGGVVNESLEIDTRHYLNHNTTTPFRVYYTENNSTTINVTSNATVTVRDTNVLSVDQNAGTMTSTNNTSINQVTFVNASYAGANTSKEVVVANETVENIDILPPLQKWTATIGDDNSLVIVIATAIAAGVAFIASSLAGVAAFPVIITGAWVAGYVATHTLLAAILMSIFVGLNVAQVVEYSGS